ncbi:MAG: hypothetical protein JO113_00650 [Candidatus Eremiobacteraeota bacterium]|nr:hypothetical protein [Candidatus Eremiobacteraeota bacterium]
MADDKKNVKDEELDKVSGGHSEHSRFGVGLEPSDPNLPPHGGVPHIENPIEGQ